MADKYHRVRTVNPKHTKKKARKKGTKKGKATMAGKRKGKRRRGGTKRRRSNPRRRRRSTALARREASTPSRRRRRNPSFASIRSKMMVDPAAPFRRGDILFRLVGKLASAAAVMRFGDPATATASTATMGGRWSIKNHIIGLLAGWLAGEAVGRLFSRERGQHVYDGAVDLSVSKAFWHELVQAIPGGTTYFGRRPMGQLPAGLLAAAQPGDTLDDGKGNRFLVQVGNDGTKRLVPMMGLQQARPLDGLQQARPLDGLQAARPLDGYQQRLLQEALRAGPTGHLAPMDDDYSEDASYQRRGSNDPFAAAFLGS